MKRVVTWMSLVVGLATLVGLVAMTASEGDADPSLPPMAVDADEASAIIAAIVADAPPAQELAPDRSVSLHDYATAANETIECLRTGVTAHGVGVEVEPPRLSDDGYEYSYQYQVAPRPDGSTLGADVVSEIDRACQSQFLAATEEVFQLQLRRRADYNDGVTDRLRDCLRSAGAAPDENAGARDLAAEAIDTPRPDSVESFNQCIGDLPSVTDVLPTETDVIDTP
jgi:hypothetical protein